MVMKAKQAFMDFSHRLPMDFSSFATDITTLALVRQLRAQPTKPFGLIHLEGCHGCGKTHLATAWLRENNVPLEDWGNMVFDAGQGGGPEQLFHAINRAWQAEHRMVVLSTPAQSEILSKLPDVRSRLAAGIFLSIPDPGDEVLTTILERHLLVHGIKLTSEDLQFFIHRLPRSPQDVIHAAELMKNIMFEQKMTAGKKLFHLVLEEIVS